MCELGNTAINKIYEARIDEITIKKPHPSSPRYSKCSVLVNSFALFVYPTFDQVLYI